MTRRAASAATAASAALRRAIARASASVARGSASLTPADKNLEVEVTDTKFESGATWTAKASVPLEGDNLIDDAKVSLTRAWSW